LRQTPGREIDDVDRFLEGVDDPVLPDAKALIKAALILAIPLDRGFRQDFHNQRRRQTDLLLAEQLAVLSGGKKGDVG
jgi:hypothetical protein